MTRAVVVLTINNYRPTQEGRGELKLCQLNLGNR
jgi:hypothetical protein